MNISKIEKLVKEYEEQTGIEAQNFRQLKVFTPGAVRAAINSDIEWHIDNTYEMVWPLEGALFCLEDYM